MEDMKKPDFDWRPSRESLIDVMGRMKTQSLFLEIGYNADAIYTLKDVDHEYNGNTYKSLKALYMQVADPTEYKFACTYLLGWEHWQRIVANKALYVFIEKWRLELEIKLRSEGVLAVRRHSQSKHPSAWQASKWLADRGWENRGAGRPTKNEIEHEKKVIAAINKDFLEDEQRLLLVK